MTARVESSLYRPPPPLHHHHHGWQALEEGTGTGQAVGQQIAPLLWRSSPSIPCIEKLLLSLFPPPDRPNSLLRPPSSFQRLRELEARCEHSLHFHQRNEFGRQSTLLEMHRRDTRRRWEPPSLSPNAQGCLGRAAPPKSLYLRPFKSNWIAQGRRDIEEGEREREGGRKREREGAAFPPSLV